ERVFPLVPVGDLDAFVVDVRKNLGAAAIARLPGQVAGQQAVFFLLGQFLVLGLHIHGKVLAQERQVRVRESSSSQTLPDRVIRLTFSSCMSKRRPICSSMVSRLITSWPGASILTIAGSRLTTASGLSS